MMFIFGRKDRETVWEWEYFTDYHYLKISYMCIYDLAPSPTKKHFKKIALDPYLPACDSKLKRKVNIWSNFF